MKITADKVEEMRMLLMGLSVLGVVLAAALAAFVAGALTRPMKALERKVTELASGDADLTARLDVKTGDEIGAIVKAFNQMMDKIQALVTQVRGSAMEVQAAAAGLSTVTQQITQSARVQSESTASTAAAVEQVTVGLGHVAESTRETRTVSEQACNLSTEGESTARETASQMMKTADSVGQSMRLIEDLSRRSNQISGIVKVIRDIASPTR
jgi:methyl-accepting chemotaxis protein